MPRPSPVGHRKDGLIDFQRELSIGIALALLLLAVSLVACVAVLSDLGSGEYHGKAKGIAMPRPVRGIFFCGLPLEKTSCRLGFLSKETTVYGLILLPAYGRSYENQVACLQDWEGGKDFKILDGPYCSVRDEGIMQQAGFNKILFTTNGQPLIELIFI